MRAGSANNQRNSRFCQVAEPVFFAQAAAGQKMLPKNDGFSRNGPQNDEIGLQKTGNIVYNGK